jgi:hypothetical protein
MTNWLETEKGKLYRANHKLYMREWRKKNPERFHATQKRVYDKKRLECLIHYSGNPPKCACCGETEILFLHIDHINGDGAEHRRQMVKDQGYVSGGNNLPYWLEKHGYPKGFQILCANCNLAKRANKICPHQLKSIK